jgi:hypothetical protein
MESQMDVVAPLARRCRRVLLVVDEDCAGCAVAVVEEAVGLADAVVAVVTLPVAARWVTAFAPLSGLTTPGRLAAEATDRAHVTARALALELPAAAVSYRVASGWPEVLRLIGAQVFDVVVAAAPRRACDRRALVAAGGASRADLWLLDAGPGASARAC